MGEFHPLVIDIDIKYNDLITERQYTDETIHHLLSYFWIKISENLNIAAHFGEAWIMEKEKHF